MAGIKVREIHTTASTALATESADVSAVSASMASFTKEELIRIEFYKTYDVMTGIRIAATLGGFFSMMILLVLYKNYCKPSKTLSEEQLNAAVSAAVEEEDRALAAALEATSFYSSLSKPRQSIGSNSAPSSQPRYSNSGGQMLRYPSQEEFCSHDDELISEDEDELPEQDRLPDYYACSYLSVPVDRRLSSVTCSSGDSSYLERRGSAFEMGHPAGPCCVRGDKRRLPVSEEPWDFYYPIDIQVIQPTPQQSPSGSEHTLYEEPFKYDASKLIHSLHVPKVSDRMHRLSVDRSEIGLAPLASISSLRSFSSQSSPIPRRVLREEEHKEDSQGSDSVFVDEIDTEDEVDEFETDSEFEDGFDDDYSFCEASPRPSSRCERRPRFASFDSCDMSLAPESETDVVPSCSRKGSKEIRRQHSMQDPGARVKRKLAKMNSDPRHIKHLPAWVERGRSGYVVKRQLSAPSSRRKEVEAKIEAAAVPADVSVPPAVVPERPPPPLPASGSSSDSPTLTQYDPGFSQGTPTPSTDRRARFQKQKTIFEGGLGAGLLAPPQVTVSGSCERLTNPALFGETNASPALPVISVEVVPDIVVASRSSSQETLC